MLIKLTFMGIIGLASGIAIAGGTFAFITWLGLVTRFTLKHKQLPIFYFMKIWWF